MQKFLENLLKIDSPSGYTNDVIKFLSNEFSKLGYDVKITNKGSLVIDINANLAKTVCLSAHVDTLGFVVRSINSDGTLKLSNVGGPIYSTVNGEYCNVITRTGQVYRGTILNQASAIHVHKDAQAKVELDNLIVQLDEVVHSRADTLALKILNGDFVCYSPKTEFSNGFIKSRFLDDKAGVAIIYQLLHNLATNDLTLNCNLKIFISVFEEVGHGGASLGFSADEMIAIDMGCVGEDLNGNEYSVSICSKDSSGPYHYDLTTNLINLATNNKLKYAVDVYPFYSSDASAAMRAGNDCKFALIGPGVSASHGMERTHIDALTNTLKLVELYLTK